VGCFPPRNGLCHRAVSPHILTEKNEVPSIRRMHRPGPQLRVLSAAQLGIDGAIASQAARSRAEAPVSPLPLNIPRALLEYPSETVVVSNSDRSAFLELARPVQMLNSGRKA
jgi:hypothetical protein